ncbi:hypothetical protein BsWGS_15273 [Bradybaena similaris]
MTAKDNIDTFTYTESDFIHQTPPWIDREASKLTKFDKELQTRWNKAMAAGVFRYGIDHIVTRIIPGSKQYVGQLNTLRATERRIPQDISSVNQPFNEHAFCFTKVKPEEVIFNLENVTSNKTAAGSPQKAWRNDVSCHSLQNGYIERLSSGSPVISQSGDSKTDSHTQPDTQQERHMLIVNVSPMEFGHCLLVPQVDSHRPQVLTQTAIQVAIETMLLSGHRGMRMGFNSLCAFASVNHLHFHLYYLEQELIVDYSPVRHLGGRYFEFTGLPCPGFALQLYGTTVSEMARLTHRISSYFQESDIAHNVFLTRGCVFGEERNSTLTTVRLFIWPRKKFIGTKSSNEFNVACIELGGHLPFKEVEGYHNLTESDVDDIIAGACLPPEQYSSIRDHITKMGLEEMENLKKHI